MTIRIRDESANALVLTIDNNGNMAFADGTPIDRLSLGGYGIIDSNGHITHGLGGGSAIPQSGSLTVGYGQTATITTIAGKTPIVQLDTVCPANSYTVDGGGGPHITPINNSTVHSCNPDSGSFTIFNENVADEATMESPVFSRGPNQNSGVGYRWM